MNRSNCQEQATEQSKENPTALCLYRDWKLMAIILLCIPGAHQGQCHCIRGRRSLLPRFQCDGVRCQCGECPPFDAVAGPDHAPQHHGNATITRDPERTDDPLGQHAGGCYRYDEADDRPAGLIGWTNKHV